MKNHKWVDDRCIHCGLDRDWRPFAIRMAIHNGKDVYKYGASYVYSGYKLEETRNRPDCPRELKYRPKFFPPILQQYNF